MAEQKQTPPQQTPPQEQKDERSDAVKQAQDDARSYEQKHQRYLDDIERIHGEP